MNQERTLPSVKASGEHIRQAFDAAVDVIEVAFHLGVKRAHQLCRVGPPVDGADQSWWQETLSDFAGRLATRPVVDTGDVMRCPNRPRDDDGEADWVEFPDPEPDSPEQLQRLWHLMRGVPPYDPPDRACVVDWVRIAREWTALPAGPRLKLFDLKTIADDVRGDIVSNPPVWTALDVEPDHRSWLLDYIDTVGFKRAHDPDWAPESYLNGLLPDQTGQLRVCAQLARDGGIPEALKDIATALGIPVRSQLLHLEIEDAIESSTHRHIKRAIESTLGTSQRSTQAVIESCVRRLDKLTPVDKKLDDQALVAARLVPELMRFLWQNLGESAAPFAQRIPLLSRAGRCQRKTMMLPHTRWPETASPHFGAWPPNRILDEAFSQDGTVDAMVGFGLVHADFSLDATMSRVDGVRLRSLMPAGEALDESSQAEQGLVVESVSLQSIPLLQEGILNRCAGNDPRPAESLLGFIVQHMAPKTDGWRSTVRAVGRQHQSEVEVELIGASWIGELQRRAWVPVGEGDDTARARPSAATLKPILEANTGWLDNNRPGVELLSRFFGLDMLDLQLFGKSPEARDIVAHLLDRTNGDVEQLQRLLDVVDDAQDADEQLGGLRAYGKAVERAVRRALEAHGLSVELIDRGFDFRVTDGPGGVEGDGAPWLVEVKATTGSEVKLTPLQARTAGERQGRYVVCVVPFETQPDPDATVALDDAVRSARVITNIGPDARETTDLVDAARHANVKIRNDESLRYAIPASRWQGGLSIEEWIGSIREELTTISGPDDGDALLS